MPHETIYRQTVPGNLQEDKHSHIHRSNFLVRQFSGKTLLLCFRRISFLHVQCGQSCILRKLRHRGTSFRFVAWLLYDIFDPVIAQPNGQTPYIRPCFLFIFRQEGFYISQVAETSECGYFVSRFPLMFVQCDKALGSRNNYCMNSGRLPVSAFS